MAFVRGRYIKEWQPKVADLPSDIMERSQLAIYAGLSVNTLVQIQGDRLGFNARLTERIAGVLNGYGVRVIQAHLTEFAPCRAIALNGYVAQGSYSLWTGF